jgi:Xaa-Pro dipeptidase
MAKRPQRARVKGIFKGLDEDVDAIYIRNSTEPIVDATFFYVTGIRSGLFESSTAIMFPDGHMDVTVPPLELTSAQGYGLKLTVVERRADITGTLQRLMAGVTRVGVNAPEVSYQAVLELQKALPGVRLVDVSRAVQRARLVKDEEEISRIRKACNVASRVAKEIPELLHEGVSESDMAAEINMRMQRYGASGPSFQTISSFGPNTAEPHYTVGKRKLRRGQFALFDYGARHERYVSDITRTFACGPVTPRMKEMYDLVREAQRIGIDMSVAGGNGRDLHKAVEDHINATRYKGRFIHSTGHSIGLSVHDGSVLHTIVDQPLEDGMVFTIEPGVYIPRYGGVRIEDDVVVRKGRKCEVLTKAPRDELIAV